MAVFCFILLYIFLCHSEFLSAALCRVYMRNDIKLEQHIYFEIRYYYDGSSPPNPQILTALKQIKMITMKLWQFHPVWGL
jgi:hypothetical protein